MTDNLTLMRNKLQKSDLRSLFVEDLGWNHHKAELSVECDGRGYGLKAVAEKHGVVAYECGPGPDGKIPEYSVRGRIEKQVSKTTHEHIVIFVDEERSCQTWQWVRREKGKPTARREHPYTCSQPGDALIQKLQKLSIDISEEETTTLVEVTGRVRQAFDVERVTKKFYDQFKVEHDAFLDFIYGIEAVADREWYASLMLNRLMFIYFIQKKKFLDGDDNYLRHRLQRIQQERGKGQFHSFYRYFLRRLFHEGLAQKKEERKPELAKLLGNIPYLNGGLFDTHTIERENPKIEIPDEAFEKLFDFFDQWEWHLDVRTGRSEKEINPDVLGYIFEKYINQKQMGAYYTKEDITEYISKSTVIPFLFDAAEKKCAIAFKPEGAVWSLLRNDPDRYIYDAVKNRVDIPLPDDIAAGIGDVSKRGGWNRPADPDYALPTETWREHLARRNRCLEVRGKLSSGGIHSINDLITYNLDLRQFAQDVIETCEGPELLRAFYTSIEEVSVLDPTCGSGAFLFAALNILEPLYEACLERMQAFLDDLQTSGEKHRPEKFHDFKETLGLANDRAMHPSLKYFILKSIVLNNLYGVDIMPEAVEICKLRLFLKLVAQVDRAEDIEPLPDIDFNIRAGNTLVGFTTLDGVRQAMTMGKNGQHRMVADEDEATLKRIEKEAQAADWAYRQFRESQNGLRMSAADFRTGKELVQKSLDKLRNELDRYMAKEYGRDRTESDFNSWQASHIPFHWLVEFYGIVGGRGFDVIIGNPPFVEYSKVRGTYAIRDYSSAESGNLYAFVAERSASLCTAGGSFGFIMPVSSTCTQRMKTLQQNLQESSVGLWVSNFAERPSKLFVGAEVLLSIWLARIGKAGECRVSSTHLTKWASEERPDLFARIAYQPVLALVKPYVIPKLTSHIENAILTKMKASKSCLGDSLVKHSEFAMFYRIGGGRYWKVFTNYRPRFVLNGIASVSSRENYLYFADASKRDIAIAALSSSMFFWYFTITTNCRDLNPVDLQEFPLDPRMIGDPTAAALRRLCDVLMGRYEKTSAMKEKRSKLTGQITYQEFYPRQSKDILDSIDVQLARHYGFSPEELDFIVNYDSKYRMGADSEIEDE